MNHQQHASKQQAQNPKSWSLRRPESGSLIWAGPYSKVPVRNQRPHPVVSLSLALQEASKRSVCLRQLQVVWQLCPTIKYSIRLLVPQPSMKRINYHAGRRELSPAIQEWLSTFYNPAASNLKADAQGERGGYVHIVCAINVKCC